MGRGVTGLDKDPRWRRLNEGEYVCACCGENHRGLFDLACHRPDQWQTGDDRSANSEVNLSSDCLTEDFCVLNGEHFFVRCVLPVPIVGGQGAEFGFGVWSTLSRKNFEIYVETFGGGEQGGLGPWFGWLSNAIKGYPDTLSMKCQVHPQNGRQRPLLKLDPTDHPLAIEQREGMTLDRILDLYALNGHDLGLPPTAKGVGGLVKNIFGVLRRP